MQYADDTVQYADDTDDTVQYADGTVQYDDDTVQYATANSTEGLQIYYGKHSISYFLSVGFSYVIYSLPIPVLQKLQRHSCTFKQLHLTLVRGFQL